MALAAVSKEPINEFQQDFEIGGTHGDQSGGGNHLRRKFSFRKKNHDLNKNHNELQINESNQPLLPKGSRLAAVKMVKGQ